jgi:pimeloyl-ACP methyl ester carboxylesterase
MRFGERAEDGRLCRETVVDQRRKRPKIAQPVASTTVEGDFSHHPAPWKWLLPGLLLLLVVFFGRHIVQLGFVHGQDEPQRTRSGIVRTLTRPDGTSIHAEVYGPTNAPTLVLTHGWGVSSTEWYYAKRQLSNRFRLIVWDLPGLGLSAQPNDRDFALEKMAADLRTVLQLADGKRVVLVGHSIGGMVNLTFCRLYPGLLGSPVAGIVQVDTTYTNPVRTTKDAGFSLALQKPVAEPVLHAIILPVACGAVPELAQLSEWLGPALQRPQFFRRVRNPWQVDFVSEFQYSSSPAVVARGTLAMFHWDATPVLPHVNTPVLILVGNQDSTTIPAASERMQQSIPGAQLQRINSGAHYSLLEQNQMVNSAAAQFASGVLK